MFQEIYSRFGKQQRVSLTYSDLNNLATILVRYTIGFGIIEVLLQDDNLQVLH
jgi:Flp pilus assembly CpaF family ATPase